MDTRMENPCSLNLVPPAKKHKPRTYVGISSQLGLGNQLEDEKTNSQTLWAKRGTGVSRRRSRSKKKLTEVAQHGTDEGRLDNTEFTFHEREDLQTGSVDEHARNMFYTRQQLVQHCDGVWKRQGAEAT
jgi:hypothetical protein